MTKYRVVTVHRVERIVRRSYNVDCEDSVEAGHFLAASNELFAKREPDLLPTTDVEFGGQRTEGMTVELLEASITGLDEHGRALAGEGG